MSKHFVLVHGAWHGSWCWDRVAASLRTAGHVVDVVDLPGRDDPAVAAVTTLDDNVSALITRIEAASSRVILVAHSLGGVTATQAAELVPDRIGLLIYLAAFVPGSGQAMADLASMSEFAASLVGIHQRIDEERGVYYLSPESRRETLYGECISEDAEPASSRLVPEGLRVRTTPVSLSPDRYGKVQRAYVETVNDRAIPIESQRAMWQAARCRPVRTMHSDHSPFLSHPHELTDVLQELSTLRLGSPDPVQSSPDELPNRLCADCLRWLRFLWAAVVSWDQATQAEARDFRRWLQAADKPTRPQSYPGSPADPGRRSCRHVRYGSRRHGCTR
jgi:pimeloyl-ACP methyl ester carboxylesterase